MSFYVIPQTAQVGIELVLIVTFTIYDIQVKLDGLGRQVCNATSIVLQRQRAVGYVCAKDKDQEGDE